MQSLIFGLIGVVVGAVLSTVLAYLSAHKQGRTHLTLALNDEFHSILEARVSAYRVLVTDPITRPVVLERLEGRTDIDSLSISTVLHFFDKVAVLHMRGMLDARLLSDLLGRYINLWAGEYLSPRYADFGSEDTWGPLKLSLERLATAMRKMPDCGESTDLGAEGGRGAPSPGGARRGEDA
jgi:hypothetical protein